MADGKVKAVIGEVTLAMDFGKFAKKGETLKVLEKNDKYCICKTKVGDLIIGEEYLKDSSYVASGSKGVSDEEANAIDSLLGKEATYDVFITKVHLDKKVKTVKTISDEISCSLKEAKAIVDKVLAKKQGDKILVIGGIPKSSAHHISKTLRKKTGATVAFTYSEEWKREEEEAKNLLMKKKEDEKKRLRELKDMEHQKLLDSLTKDQILFSQITGGKLPLSGIDYKIDRYPDNHWDKEYHVDIPEIDDTYVWSPELLEMLILSHKLNKKSLLTGMPGTGKSTAVKQFAAIKRQPYMRFNGKDGVEPSSFLGYPWATKEGMEWKDGLLPIGVKEGYLVTIDEVFKLPAGINMAMQNLYEQDGTLLLDDKPGEIKDKLCIPRNEFRMFLTDNAKGTGDNFSKYAATQIADTSTLDRFALTMEVDYLKVDQEVKLLLSKTGGKHKENITKLVKFAGLVRNGYRGDDLAVTLSPRGLFSIVELMMEGIPIAHAIKLCFSNKIADDSETAAIREMLSTCKIK